MGAEQPRGSLLMSVLAVVSAICAFIQYKADGDVRWIIGGATILATWPYAYFVIVPVNVWLCALPAGRPVSPARKLMRDWGVAGVGSSAHRICSRMRFRVGDGLAGELMVINAGGQRLSQYHDPNPTNVSARRC
jgi:hypothetical protein